MAMMRRDDRAITEEEALVLLNEAEYGVLSTVSEDGRPYGVPLSFCVIDRSVYFHCAVEGRKLDNIEHNTSVSFCAVGRTRIQPEKFSTEYESVIVEGVAEEAAGADKRKGLEGLVQKYSVDYIDKGSKYIDSAFETTRVFKISIETISGKARRA